MVTSLDIFTKASAMTRQGVSMVMHKMSAHKSVFRNGGEDFRSRVRLVDLSHFTNIPVWHTTLDSENRHNGHGVKDQSAVDRDTDTVERQTLIMAGRKHIEPRIEVAHGTSDTSKTEFPTATNSTAHHLDVSYPVF